METLNFVYYQEADMWVGWLKAFPAYRTQGINLDDLKDNLKDLYKDIKSGVAGR